VRKNSAVVGESRLHNELRGGWASIVLIIGIGFRGGREKVLKGQKVGGEMKQNDTPNTSGCQKKIDDLKIFVAGKRLTGRKDLEIDEKMACRNSQWLGEPGVGSNSGCTHKNDQKAVQEGNLTYEEKENIVRTKEKHGSENQFVSANGLGDRDETSVHTGKEKRPGGGGAGLERRDIAGGVYKPTRNRLGSPDATVSLRQRTQLR